MGWWLIYPIYRCYSIDDTMSVTGYVRRVWPDGIQPHSQHSQDQERFDYR